LENALEFFLAGPGSLNSPLAAEVFAFQAYLFRRQDRARDAIGRLKQALTLLAHQPGAYADVVRCRILDELGLAHHELEEWEDARRRLTEALDIRRGSLNEPAVAQSQVNLARLAVASGDLTAARSSADEAVAILRKTSPSALLANAEVLCAQVRLRQGLPEEAVDNADRAVSLNAQLGNRRGEAISQLVTAQCLRAAGDTVNALRHAEESLQINAEIGNEYGEQRARWLIEQLNR
jgi:tetratricopeptide (TPR) repeat protein